MRSVVAGAVSAAVTSATVRNGARAVRAFQRRFRRGRPHVHYFHEVGDPYSHLSAQLLPRLAESYDVTLTAHLVSPPEAAAAPEPKLLSSYALSDAALLARAHGLTFPARAPRPPENARAAVASKLARAADIHSFAQTALEHEGAMWRGERVRNAGPCADATAEGDALRRALGHYLGGVFHFEGEWYWGPDRLPYLEERLGFVRLTHAPVVTRKSEGAPVDARGATLDFFLSLRSPYTYLAAARVRELAARANAKLRLRPVLPMVMRGLPVPGPKRLYIVRDTKREAETLGMPFGHICDPVGAPAERGLAVLCHAIEVNKGSAFAESFLRGVFSEGVDAGSDRGLLHLAARANISEALVRDALADESWRVTAEANRLELFRLGLWGVPSFRVEGAPARWGQDRLWAVEEDLRAFGAAKGSV